MNRDEHAQWFKSSYSNGNGNCVEVRRGGTAVGARDSKQQAGPVMLVSRESWQAFVFGVCRDDLTR